MNKQSRLLFVCMGNICRSPTAEGIMLHLISKDGLENLIECDSAGTIVTTKMYWFWTLLENMHIKSEG